MSRTRVSVLCAAGVVFVGGLVWTWSDAAGQVGGGGPIPSPGMPRAWEGGLLVTDYSMFNLPNGNLLTTLTLVSWRLTRASTSTTNSATGRRVSTT